LVSSFAAVKGSKSTATLKREKEEADAEGAVDVS
jgi:hypothetical protein